MDQQSPRFYGVTGVEVIDHTHDGAGRECVSRFDDGDGVEVHLQDEGRTLKIIKNDKNAKKQ